MNHFSHSTGETKFLGLQTLLGVHAVGSVKNTLWARRPCMSVTCFLRTKLLACREVIVKAHCCKCWNWVRFWCSCSNSGESGLETMFQRWKPMSLLEHIVVALWTEIIVGVHYGNSVNRTVEHIVAQYKLRLLLEHILVILNRVQCWITVSSDKTVVFDTIFAFSCHTHVDAIGVTLRMPIKCHCTWKSTPI
jgi:hypothetical protein